METCLVNLLEPGDEALICVHGVFGNRMADIVERCGAKLIRVDAPWGKPIDPRQVKEALRKCKPKLVAIVHAETSTGVLQPLEEISRLTHEAGALFVVDAVTSYCGTEVKVDDWGIDAIYSGSQKCLSAPPGLSPVSFSQKAVEVLEKRKTKVQSWFLDLSLVRSYWAGAKRAYHHTAPISAMFAFREALRLVLEEGLEDSLQFYSLDTFDARKISSTNVLERLNEEIRRRSRVVGVFPSEDSYVRLITCYLIEYSEDWGTSRSYIKQETIEELRARLKPAA